MTAQQEPQEKFRGNWVRPEIFYMVDRGDISIPEAWLLLLIDNFVEHGKKDCWASNTHFAKTLRCQERNIRKMLTKLKRLGLVYQTGFDGRIRYLATSWSHHQPGPGGPGALQPGPPVLSRQVPQDQATRSPRTRLSPADNGKNRAIPRKIIVRLKRLIYKGNIQVEKQHCLTCRETDWKKVSKVLEEAISKVRTIPATAKRNTWHEHIRKVHTLDGIAVNEVVAVVEWYATTLVKEGDPSRTKSFLPEAFSGAAFRKKWDQLVSARNRRGGQAPKPKMKMVAEDLELQQDPDPFF